MVLPQSRIARNSICFDPRPLSFVEELIDNLLQSSMKCVNLHIPSALHLTWIDEAGRVPNHRDNLGGLLKHNLILVAISILILFIANLSFVFHNSPNSAAESGTSRGCVGCHLVADDSISTGTGAWRIHHHPSSFGDTFHASDDQADIAIASECKGAVASVNTVSKDRSIVIAGNTVGLTLGMSHEPVGADSIHILRPGVVVGYVHTERLAGRPKGLLLLKKFLAHEGHIVSCNGANLTVDQCISDR
mmetsp:Transcript_326/g.921  ORF Transcript_326/g.921 Transcript_326/m.921 type:complete len:247 (-) Transcript_326:776-1516(-)